MIYKKYWHAYHNHERYNYMGIFLLGLIPLYIRRT